MATPPPHGVGMRTVVNAAADTTNSVSDGQGIMAPNTQQDYDDIVECAYRFAVDETLIENELEKRRNNGK